jgi:hypothetical protein
MKVLQTQVSPAKQSCLWVTSFFYWACCLACFSFCVGLSLVVLSGLLSDLTLHSKGRADARPLI